MGRPALPPQHKSCATLIELGLAPTAVESVRN